MILINLLFLTLSISLADSNLLDKMNKLEREKIICRDGNMESWGIPCSTDYEIIFHKVKRKFLSNIIHLEGKVHSTGSYQSAIPYMKVELIKLEDDGCIVIKTTETNLEGKFKITFDETRASYLQFSDVGFTGYSIKL